MPKMPPPFVFPKTTPSCFPILWAATKRESFWRPSPVATCRFTGPKATYSSAAASPIPPAASPITTLASRSKSVLKDRPEKAVVTFLDALAQAAVLPALEGDQFAVGKVCLHMGPDLFGETGVVKGHIGLGVGSHRPRSEIYRTN